MRAIWLALLSVFYLADISVASYGASIDGQLKYQRDFSRFDYTSSDAAKGGRVLLHDIGSFDKVNPFTLKGTVAHLLEELVYEPLCEQSLDEPLSVYGLIAKEIIVPDDHKSVTFILNENARFSDGSKITIRDVAYTIDTLTGKDVHPFYNSYYHEIKDYELLGEYSIRVNFTNANREMHLIVAQMKIMPENRHETFFSATPNLRDGSYYPLGSGPYVVASITPGKSITYKRNPDYWAADHPTKKGMYNFDEIVVSYYKDQIVALEAFKAGEFDFISINIAKQWARDLQGRRFANGELVKQEFPHKNIAGMQGFTMNTRRPIFSDIRVREAMGLALNFEWINEALFHGQYQRNESFFSNSHLAATGLPEGLELEYLNKHKDLLDPAVFSYEPTAPRVERKGDLRKNLLKARELLSQAGWNIFNGTLQNSEGEPFVFEFLISNQSLERVLAVFTNNLEKLGIQVHSRTVDPALYVSRVKAFDYDMIVTGYAQSQSPGNEQISYWHSSSVSKTGSRNFAGVNSPVVDDLVDKIVYAKKQEELTAACRALDRVLWYGYYTIPNWYLSYHRLSFTSDFQRPKSLPLYYNYFQFLMTWWKDIDA